MPKYKFLEVFWQNMTVGPHSIERLGIESAMKMDAQITTFKIKAWIFVNLGLFEVLFPKFPREGGMPPDLQGPDSVLTQPSSHC